jgi:hypothetical protein
MRRLFATLVLLYPCTLLAADITEIEKRRLFEPTASERAEEAAGRIYIYDGLPDKVVEEAVDQEFHRIENMMFIRTKKTNPDGSVRKDPKTGDVQVEDDGC